MNYSKCFKNANEIFLYFLGEVTFSDRLYVFTFFLRNFRNNEVVNHKNRKTLVKKETCKFLFSHKKTNYFEVFSFSFRLYNFIS